MTYQSVSWSTSAAPSSCWIWPLDAAAACGTSQLCHTSVGRWCKKTASSVDETVCCLCGVSAGGSWSSGGHTQSWSSLSAEWRGSSCMDQCWVHWRTPRTSKGSWCREGNGEELQRTTAERIKMRSENTEAGPKNRKRYYPIGKSWFGGYSPMYSFSIWKVYHREQQLFSPWIHTKMLARCVECY